MACMPLQGMAMVMERIQGVAHSHVWPDPKAHPAAAQVAPLDLPVLLPLQALRYGHSGGRPPADVAAWMGRSTALGVEPPHHHDATERHSHAAADVTVVRAAEPAADSEAPAGTAPKRLLLDMDSPPIVVVAWAATAACSEVQPAEAVPATRPPGERLERPPRSVQR